MQIPLNHFEQYINEPILKRGLQYFKQGYVGEPIDVGLGKFEVLVQGSEEYTVKLTIKNNIITEHVCSCPYDLSAVCKHVTAVIFYLLQEQLQLKVSPKKTNSKRGTKPIKRDKLANEIDNLLEKISHNDLKEFVRKHSADNKDFRNLFISSFIQSDSKQSKEIVTHQIKAILKSAKARRGYVDYSGTRAIGIAINNLLETAEGHFRNNNKITAYSIYCAIMEQLIPALQYIDDSRGDVGCCIDVAFNKLFQIAYFPENEAFRKEMLNYSFNLIKKEKYEGWDWHIGMLEIAAQLVSSKQELEEIEQLIKQVGQSKYNRERAQLIHYNIILKNHGQTEAEIFLNKHIGNASLRQVALENAVHDKQFKQAEKIALDGVVHDMPKFPGLVNKWYNWLLKIALAENNPKKIIQHARYLLINSHEGHELYFRHVKEQTPAKKWGAYLEDLIKEIKASRPQYNTSLLAYVYIQETRWDDLLALLQVYSSFYTIDEYAKYFPSHYSSKIAILYANAVANYVDQKLGREHYQLACRYIRRIIKLGEQDLAMRVISDLKNRFPKRSSLLEELNKV